MKKFTASDTQQLETLLDEGGLTIIHIHLEAGVKVSRHHTPESAVIIIYKGKVLFSSDEETVEIVPGKVIALAPNEWHHLESVEESDIMVVKSILKK